MPDPASKPRQEDVRDHLANERAFPAWMRTSLAIITFGIGLNRFSLYGSHEIARGQIDARDFIAARVSPWSSRP